MTTSSIDFIASSSRGPAPGDAAAGKVLGAGGGWVSPGVRHDAPQSLSSGEQQQAQENIGATTAGRAVLTAASASAQRAAINAAPQPQIASGIGQVVNLAPGSAAAAVLPAGGTWMWGVFSFATSGTNIAQGWSSGVDAGGTTVRSASGTQTHTGFAWRIA